MVAVLPVRAHPIAQHMLADRQRLGHRLHGVAARRTSVALLGGIQPPARFRVTRRVDGGSGTARTSR